MADLIVKCWTWKNSEVVQVVKRDFRTWIENQLWNKRKFITRQHVQLFMFLAQMHFASEEISSQLHLTTELVFKSKFIQKLNMPAQASALGQVLNSPPLFELLFCFLKRLDLCFPSILALIKFSWPLRKKVLKIIWAVSFRNVIVR